MKPIATRRIPMRRTCRPICGRKARRTGRRNIRKEFQDNTPALAGYTFADGSDHRARGYFAQSSRVAFDFQHAGLAAPRTPRDDARPARQRHHDGL